MLSKHHELLELPQFVYPVMLSCQCELFKLLHGLIAVIHTLITVLHAQILILTSLLPKFQQLGLPLPHPLFRF